MQTCSSALPHFLLAGDTTPPWCSPTPLAFAPPKSPPPFLSLPRGRALACSPAKGIRAAGPRDEEAWDGGETDNAAMPFAQIGGRLSSRRLFLPPPPPQGGACRVAAGAPHTLVASAEGQSWELAVPRARSRCTFSGAAGNTVSEGAVFLLAFNLEDNPTTALFFLLTHFRSGVRQLFKSFLEKLYFQPLQHL